MISQTQIRKFQEHNKKKNVPPFKKAQPETSRRQKKLDYVYYSHLCSRAVDCGRVVEWPKEPERMQSELVPWRRMLLRAWCYTEAPGKAWHVPTYPITRVQAGGLWALPWWTGQTLTIHVKGGMIWRMQSTKWFCVYYSMYLAWPVAAILDTQEIILWSCLSNINADVSNKTYFNVFSLVGTNRSGQLRDFVYSNVFSFKR